MLERSGRKINTTRPAGNIGTPNQCAILFEITSQVSSQAPCRALWEVNHAESSKQRDLQRADQKEQVGSNAMRTLQMDN